MIQPYCSVQLLPHGGACVGENIYAGTSCLLYTFGERTAHNALLGESCWAGGSLHVWSYSEPDPQLWVTLLPSSHTASIPGLL